MMKKNKSKNRRYKLCKYAGPDGFKGCRTCCKKFKRNKKTYKKCLKHCMTTKYKPKKYQKGGSFFSNTVCRHAGPDGASGCRDCCELNFNNNNLNKMCVSDCMLN